jgi:hypothetical protein
MLIGDGESIESSIIIHNSTSTMEGIKFENRYLEVEFGPMGEKWKKTRQFLLNIEGKRYDEIELKLASGEIVKRYFDITSFFGK